MFVNIDFDITKKLGGVLGLRLSVAEEGVFVEKVQVLVGLDIFDPRRLM